jgi:acyl-coenzyme A thioesterase PaaI-like protein
MASSVDLLAEFREVVDGPFAGWRIWFASPFETHTGPFYWRIEETGSVTGAWVPEEKNTNDVSSVHGGALMTFADAVTGAETLFATDGRAVAVTVAFNSEFMGAGVTGAPIHGTARLLRETKSMVFVQGQLEQNGLPILAFSSTAKKITQR